MWKWFLEFLLILPYMLDDMAVNIVAKDSRARLYGKMARDLYEKGALFLNQGETSQSLALSDIFSLKDGSITPILKVKCELYMSIFYHLHFASW